MAKEALVFSQMSRTRLCLSRQNQGGSAKNLLEVIEIQFEEMSRMGTLDEYLEECGYDLKIFETHGCTYVRKKGSHHILTCPEGKRAVVIPEYDEVDVDIIKNNMRTAGMSRNQYFALLEKI